MKDVVVKIVGGGTPSRKNERYYQGDIPWVTVKDLISSSISDTQEKITLKAIEESATNLIPKSNVIIATRMALGKAFINEVDVAINQDLKALIPNKEKIIPKYLLYVYLSNKEKIESLGSGTTVKGIRLEQVNELELFVPAIAEQKKITTILSSIDEAIEKTEAIIERTEEVKKGFMQQLLTKGIGHTRFKKTKIGEIPEKWEVVKLKDVLELVTRPLSMKDEEGYQLVTVKRRNGGIVPREVLKGKEIKVKSQFYIKKGDFLISKRQIVHGACEVVPSNLDGAIVSNEYHTLLSKSNLEMDFFKWYSRTPLMMNYFLLSSVGVHIEKMLFRVEDWFKREIVLPPLEEQVEIVKTLSSIQNSININQEYLNKLQHLKKGLMQSLLTGKIRVKIDEAEVTQV
ncbi:TPA: restriction endonuclease subunit S [Bacillus toyonensis]|nr:restriction endonuclease subunit S [Bacillus toyonensis]